MHGNNKNLSLTAAFTGITGGLIAATYYTAITTGDPVASTAALGVTLSSLFATALFARESNQPYSKQATPAPARHNLS